MKRIDLAIGIGGAAGQGIATPGDVLARIFIRHGLHINAYNAYQSIIRGGHIFLTLRTSDQPVLTYGDKLDVLMPLNQDTMDRHLKLMRAGSAVLFNSDTITPGAAPDGVQLCPFSVKALAPAIRGDLVQNTIALAAVLRLITVEFEILAEILTLQFRRKGEAAIAENVGVARAGYDYAATHFTPFPFSLPDTGKRLAFLEGNQALAMGGAAAGVRFYRAYPMSPSTGVLHWMARHARQLGIMVRQVEDEIGVINMAIGAAHAGCRAMCATSGGGFALMSEALGSAAMMEIPVVCIDVQRAGPATGVPTKTRAISGKCWAPARGIIPASSSPRRRSPIASRSSRDSSTWSTDSSVQASSSPICFFPKVGPASTRWSWISTRPSTAATSSASTVTRRRRTAISSATSSPRAASRPGRCREPPDTPTSWPPMNTTRRAC